MVKVNLHSWALIATVGFTYPLNAQKSISTSALLSDRPYLSNPPQTIGVGQFQFELGGQVGESTNKAFPEFTEWAIPSFSFRTGIARRIEARVGATLRRFRQGQLDTYNAGLRWKVLENRRWVPALAIQPTLELSTQCYCAGPAAAGKVKALFSNRVAEWLMINYAVEAYVAGSALFYPGIVLSSALLFQLGRRVTYFMEGFTDPWQSYNGGLKSGLGMLLAENVRIDAYLGYGHISAIVYDKFRFGGLGVTYRVD